MHHMASLSLQERSALLAIATLTALAGVANYEAWAAVPRFAAATLALAGLAWMVSFATEQLGERFGPGVTGMMQSTLGNLPELFVVIFALQKGELVVAQTAIVGSILANALLVLGLVIVVGARRAPDGMMRFSKRLPRDTATLLQVTVFIIVLLGLSLGAHDPASHHVKTISAVGAVCLLIVYMAWVVPYLRSDSAPGGIAPGDIAPGDIAPGDVAPGGIAPGDIAPGDVAPGGIAPGDVAPADAAAGKGDLRAGDGAQHPPVDGGARPAGGNVEHPMEDEARTGPRLSLGLTLVLLVVAGAASAFVSDWFVNGLQPAISILHISQAFAGLVIVAIAGNAVENTAGLVLSHKGRSDLAISVVKNSVAQIAAFLFPLLVLVSLLLATTLTFALAPVYIGALALTALALWQVTGDGEAAEFEGWALVALYVILATLTLYE
jgi:Ca2+:H+ antiporter